VSERTLFPQHQRAIDKLTAHYAADETAIALIIGGSVAKGWALETSDLDFILVLPDAEVERRSANLQQTIFSLDFTDYEGGYIDGKAITLGFLREVADHGSEPARSAFVGTWCAFDRSPDQEVTQLIQAAQRYPEEGADERIRAYLAQLGIWSWFVREAEKRQDRYLLLQAVTSLALFGMRIVLTENRRIYPYHKWVSRAVRELTDKPTYFEKLRDAMLNVPSNDTAKAFTDAVFAWRNYELAPGESTHRFVQDREWTWRENKTPIEDW
jgi:hypothetical protein